RPESLTAVMKEAMRDYTAHAMSAVEKRFPVLQTVGNAAPLLGMTGTVVGMITAFAGMAESGVSNEAVSAGISEALITTAAGLIIALIAVVPLNYFTAVADKIELEIEESSAELLEFVATRIETEAA
ncbi:MAG: MotA/TolQ/ExbB proton channel family protein, partial [Planctomycetota bacterium]|nr:MotA/TolQ/ExbB proton channel family protein [Planctomycetota bacterium]